MILTNEQIYNYEIEPNLNGFYVYILKKPNGDVFYIGKGKGKRAFDFSPSRRTKYFLNIIKKYGRENILIEQYPCMYEKEAFELEKALINIHRNFLGKKLANFTSGGEGRAGIKASPKQLEALKKGRGKDHYANMPIESKKSILDGLARGREKSKTWKASIEGQAHLQLLCKLGAEVLHKERNVVCIQCNINFITRSAKAKNCSRRCEQKTRRARTKL